MNVNIFELPQRPDLNKIAEELGVTPNYVRKIIKRERTPSPKIAKKLIQMAPSGALSYERIYDEYEN